MGEDVGSALHLIVVQHGLWGNPGQLQYLCDLFRTSFAHAVVINSAVSTSQLTFDGIDCCGDRLVTLVESIVEEHARQGLTVAKISLIGYSLGGLICRYAVGKLFASGALLWMRATDSVISSAGAQQILASADDPLQCNRIINRKTNFSFALCTWFAVFLCAICRYILVDTRIGCNRRSASKVMAWCCPNSNTLPRKQAFAVVKFPEKHALRALLADFFSKVQPVNFVTIATPHLGSWLTPDGILARAFNSLIPIMISRTGHQLVFTDSLFQGRPLMEVMTDPGLAFHQGLQRFQHLCAMANISNDRSVPYCTAALR